MKIKTSFTGGPWKHEKHCIGFSTADFITCNGQKFNMMHVRLGEKEYGWSTKESAANARLIAKAPEMFELLFDIANQIKNHPELSREIFDLNIFKRIDKIGKEIHGS